MIYEVTELYIKPDAHEAFQAGARQAVPLFQRAKGCLSMRIDRSIETPDIYRLVIAWATLDDHVVGFRESPDFAAWRALVSDSFTAPPKALHFETALTGF